MKRTIRKAVLGASDHSDKYEETLSNLEDDFSFFLEGVDKLARSGQQLEKSAIEIMLSLSAELQKSIQQTASMLVK